MPAHSEGSRASGRVPELDGVRGIAVGLVLLFHFWPNQGVWRLALPFTDAGWIGVDLFFVLSGFLITGILLDTAGRSDYYSRFYLRRAFRIFPLYYSLLIAVLVFVGWWQGGLYLSRLKSEWGSPVWFFIYLANFVSAAKGIFIPVAPLGPTWSLQIEEQFYLCFPFLVRRLRERIWILLVAILALAPCWRLLTLLLYGHNDVYQYVSTLCRVDTLAAGGLAAYVVRYRPADQWQRVVRHFLPVCSVAMFVVYGFVANSFASAFIRTVGFSLNAVTFALLVLWISQGAGTSRTVLFRVKPLRFLGTISYGVYLLQLPVQSAVKVLTGISLGSSERPAFQCALWLAATIATACFSYRWFEKPLLDYGHRLSTRTLPIAAEPVAVPAGSQ